jgi:ferredoxin
MRRQDRQNAMKQLSPEDMLRFFTSVSCRYDLRLPILLADGGRSIGRLTDGPLAMTGGALPAKPTSFFFPQEEEVFTARGGEYTLPAPADKPLFIVGFTPADLRCLMFIDRFFATGERDDLYFRLRERAVIATVSGYCGANGSFIPPATGGGDLEFVFDGTRWLVSPHSPVGAEIIAPLEGAPADCRTSLLQTAAHEATAEEAIISQAASILRNREIPDSFWSDIGSRCIQCSGCNLVCPTCTCFGVQDWRFAERTERRRMWDSCQLSGFMREAGGHNPLGTAALRTRRRIHHKLAADPLRWGEISCFLCGRCDRVCPTGIGIVAVAGEIVAQFGKSVIIGE